MMTIVFNISDKKEKVICPPKQVFANRDFTYMLTLGGHIADNEDEYQRLMNLLKQLHEREFFILENLGATITDRTIPLFATISSSSTFIDFNKTVKQFDPPFGFWANHFFIYGKNRSWGIYICENPTINIIGCKKELIKDFSLVFDVKGNGYEALKDFLVQEFQTHPHLLKEMIDNYHLA
jgi:hypothetical protein